MELNVMKLCSGFLGFVMALMFLIYPFFAIRDLLLGKGFRWEVGERSLKGPLAVLAVILVSAVCCYACPAALCLGMEQWFGIQLPDWLPRLPTE